MCSYGYLRLCVLNEGFRYASLLQPAHFLLHGLSVLSWVLHPFVSEWIPHHTMRKSISSSESGSE